ncbi:MAG: phosphatase [Thermoflexibacter sp.]|jgi:acid phosphatase (class A)|nr:phosphatase [Thermoflexibacter sp.]
MIKIVIKLLLIKVLSLAFSATFAQEKIDFPAARGHYKMLQQYSKKPLEARKTWDSLSFPFYKENYERRMSLKPIYLTNIKPEDFRMPEMPANSSAQTRAELDYLFQLQQRRSAEDERASLFYADVWYNLRTKSTDENYPRMQRNLFHIGRSIGTWFNADSLPKTAKLIANVWQDASYFIWYFKFKYARVRPYKLEPKLKNLQETDWAAYPSGHAANSYINAFIFRAFAPEFADSFMKDAYDMAHSREIIGVHYPSDSEASREMAWQLVSFLFQNEQFIKDFAEAKKEWEKYRVK